MITAGPQPLWPDELTAVGTLLLAILTFAVVVTTIIVTVTDRRRASRKDQLAQAGLVQVVRGERNAGEVDPVYGEPVGPPTKRLGVMVVNHGAFTITDIVASARWPGDNERRPMARSERVNAASDLDTDVAGGMSGLYEGLRADRLTPWDKGVRFESEPARSLDVAVATPFVQWTDWLGLRWENELGRLRMISDKPPAPWRELLEPL